MKAIVKLLLTVAILNATARLGLSALRQYQFRDDVQQIVLFGAGQSAPQLTEAILGAAETRGVPLTPADVEIERQGTLTTASATYVDQLELFPRYVYPLTWSFKVDARTFGGSLGPRRR